jgi:hypothetical protein
MIGRMLSPYGRGVAVAVFLCVIALSPYAQAAETNALAINDPITDMVQLWSAVVSSMESLAQLLAAVLQPYTTLTANNSHKPYVPNNPTPPSLAASVALATQSSPETATTSGGVFGTSITPQQPQSTNLRGAASDHTTHSLFDRSASASIENWLADKKEKKS